MWRCRGRGRVSWTNLPSSIAYCVTGADTGRRRADGDAAGVIEALTAAVTAAHLYHLSSRSSSRRWHRFQSAARYRSLAGCTHAARSLAALNVPRLTLELSPKSSVADVRSAEPGPALRGEDEGLPHACRCAIRRGTDGAGQRDGRARLRR